LKYFLLNPVANNNPTASAQPETVELLNPSNLSTSTTAEEQESGNLEASDVPRSHKETNESASHSEPGKDLVNNINKQ
jgi:hypothetical protein